MPINEHAHIGPEQGHQRPMHRADVGVAVGLDELLLRRACVESMADLITIIPELKARPEITQKVIDISGALQINKDFFDDKGRAIALAGIVAKSFEVSSATSVADGEDYLANAAASLVSSYSPVLREIDRGDSHELSDDVKGAVYDRFTNQELSLALTDAIKNDGLLDVVRRGMGIVVDNEDPFTIRVMDLMTSGEGELVGQLDMQEVQESNSRFMDESAEGFIAPAWVTQIGGSNNLCITLPVARRILGVESGVSEQRASLDRSVLEHEYAHTQGGLNIDHGIDFGVALEEWRAEYFSGNRQGYLEIKGFLQAVSLATGLNLPELIGSKHKGGSKGEVYSELANNLGLANMADFLMIRPREYNDDVSDYSSAAASHVPTMGNFIDRMLLDDEGQAHERVYEYAKRLAALNIDHHFYLDSRFPSGATGSMGDRLKDAVDRIKQYQGV